MRIAFVSAANIPSRFAHSIQVAKMVDAFARLGHDVRLITRGSIPSCRVPSSRFRNHYGVRSRFRLIRLPFRRAAADGRAALWCFGRVAVALARMTRCDLLFARDYLPAVFAARAGLPTIAETHRPAAGEGVDPRFAMLLETAGRFPALRGIVTISALLARSYREAGVAEERLLVEPDGVDLAAYRDLPAPSVARAALGESATGMLVVHAGHLYADRGIDVILEAARRRPGAWFRFYGGMEEDVARWRARSADQPNVRFEGFVPNRELPIRQIAADVLLLSYSRSLRSAEYASPLKLYEYMAAGRPIVASRIPALAGVLEDGRNALLVEPDSPEALLAALDRLSADPELGVRLAAAARQDVAPFSWMQRARRILGRFANGIEAA